MRRELQPQASDRPRRLRGFTMIEAVISIVVASVAVLVTMVVVGSMGQQLRGQRSLVAGQDNVGVVVDQITRQLRSAGSGADHSRGQSRFLHASGYTVAFNANLTPTGDDLASPLAVDPGLADATVPLDDDATYTPPRSFATGAETIVITLDSNRDGRIGSDDAADDEDESDTDDASDYVVSAFVYGSDGAANTIVNRGLGIVRGPSAGSAAGADEPLFTYWVDADNDPSTEPALHGDQDSDGHLSASEAAAAGAVPAADLALIERIDIAATATQKQHTEAAAQGGDYNTVKPPVLRSTVSFRNRNTTIARIVGRVYNDADGDGAMDTAELPIPGVVITCTNGQRTRTGTTGYYQFVVAPGTYAVSEIDPAQYTSTTPNTVNVEPRPGDYVEVNFGDRSGLGTGFIHGKVFADDNRNGSMEPEERGIRGVRLSLDNGVSTVSDTLGLYVFPVSVGFYVVTEEDSIGYVSSTPNVVEANVETPGDSVRVDFGDYLLVGSGTIHGIVYHDVDNDATLDTGEVGVPNVLIELDDGQTTTTDTNGQFRLSTEAGTHRITEHDPAGYTSSTVNTLEIEVRTNETIEVAFGDIAQEDIQFQEIVLGNTERALSISTFNTAEDARGDTDMVLGTHYVGGANDILTWWNHRTNVNTPNASIFSSTPTYSRVVAADVNALVTADLNRDGAGDLITGLGSAVNNIAVWHMGTGASMQGKLPFSPTALYTTAGALGVKDMARGKFDEDSHLDLVVGAQMTSTTGLFEIWHGDGSGLFARQDGDVHVVIPGGGQGIGSVQGVAAADFDADGVTDVVLAAQTGIEQSVVYVIIYDNQAQGRYRLMTTVPIRGSVQDVMALDMREDNRGDIDLVVATGSDQNAGEVQVWHNRGDGNFGAGDTPNTEPDDFADPGGIPLCLTTAFIDNDVYPDLIVGTRSSSYMGNVVIYRAFGYLPTNGQVISTTTVGEVIASTVADFNRDGASDVAIGTRTTGSAGKVVVYFNVRPAL